MVKVKFPRLGKLSGEYPAIVSVEAPRGLLPAGRRFYAIENLSRIIDTDYKVLTRWPDDSARIVHLHGDFKWDRGQASNLVLVAGSQSSDRISSQPVPIAVETGGVLPDLVVHCQRYLTWDDHAVNLRFMQNMQGVSLPFIRLRLPNMDAKRVIVRHRDKHPEQSVEQDGTDCLIYLWKPSRRIENELSLENLPRQPWLTYDEAFCFSAPGRVVEAIRQYRADKATAAEFIEHALDPHISKQNPTGMGVTIHFAILANTDNISDKHTAYAISPIGLASEELRTTKHIKDAVAKVVESGPGNIERLGLHGWLYGEVPHAELSATEFPPAGRINNHRSGNVHTHYFGLFQACRLFAQSGDVQLLNWVRVLTRYNIDLAFSWQYAQHRRMRPIAYSPYWETFQHGVDSVGLLLSWRLTGSPFALEAFEAWEKAARSENRFTAFLRQTAYREFAGALTQCLAAWDHTRDQLWEDRINVLVPKLLVDDLTTQTGPMFHPWWFAELDRLRAEGLNAPDARDAACTWVVRWNNNVRLGLSAMMCHYADEHDPRIGVMLANMKYVLPIPNLGDGLLPAQLTYLPDREYSWVNDCEDYPSGHRGFSPSDTRKPSVIEIEKGDDLPLLLTFYGRSPSTPSSLRKLHVVPPSGEEYTLSSDLFPGDGLLGITSTKPLDPLLSHARTPSLRLKIKRQIELTGKAGTYLLKVDGPSVNFPPLQPKWPERAILQPGGRYYVQHCQMSVTPGVAATVTRVGTSAWYLNGRRVSEASRTIKTGATLSLHTSETDYLIIETQQELKVWSTLEALE